MSLIVVLVMLTVLLLGALSMSRVTATTTLLAGNQVFRDSALQASEVGVNDAFAALSALSNYDEAVDSWYFPLAQETDSSGVPSGLDWNSAPSTTVGAYTVRYVVERMCQGSLPVLDAQRQCVNYATGSSGSAKAGTESLASPFAQQYRITVLVTGPKSTSVTVQTTASI